MLEDKTQVQEEKQIERQRMVSLINSMADGVIAVDEHGMVVLFNGAALNVLDVNNIEKGASIAKVISITDQNGGEVDIKELVQNTKTQTTNRDYRLKYTDGSTINLYLSIAPVHLGYGESGDRGFVLLLRDITREKSLEEERDEFISVVSHELRTPITIAEGNLSNALYLANKEQLPDTFMTAVKQSYDQVGLLAGMINDLSTLSRAERGVLEAEVEDINAREVVELLANEYRASAEEKGLTIQTDIDPRLEVFKNTKLYVREILQNFITNSIKYTEKGHVLLSAKPHEQGVLFEVSDTGIGISKADQEKVFDKFFRSEDYRTRQNNGTGLGLYVTMKLARLVKADINLTSEVDKGSTFSIYIPSISK